MAITKSMKNLEIYNIAISLMENFKDELNLPVKVNFYLQKNMTTIVEMAQEIDKTRKEIIEKFGTPVEEGSDEITVAPENLDAANKELTDLFELEQDVKIYPIKLDWFGDINFSSQQVAAITYMIEEE